jgi:hypothetical protein
MSLTLPTTPATIENGASGASHLLRPAVVLRAVLLAIALLYAATTLRALLSPGSHSPAHDDRSSLLLDR